MINSPARFLFLILKASSLLATASSAYAFSFLHFEIEVLCLQLIQ
jgi:hypothetical protein